MSSDTTRDKLVSSFKSQLEDIKKETDELKSKYTSLLNELRNVCPHNNIQDFTETRGKQMDNGYGKWWRQPHFECLDCGKVDTSYNNSFYSDRKMRLRKNLKMSEPLILKKPEETPSIEVTCSCEALLECRVEHFSPLEGGGADRDGSALPKSTKVRCPNCKDNIRIYESKLPKDWVRKLSR